MPSATATAVNRDQAVHLIREILSKSVDGATCMCKAAADQSIFCLGFKRYNDAELRRRYAWIVKKRPGVNRIELERLANDWEIAQQKVLGLDFTCDVQARAHDTCYGWDQFTNAQLEEFCAELSGASVHVE